MNTQSSSTIRFSSLRAAALGLSAALLMTACGSSQKQDDPDVLTETSADIHREVLRDPSPGLKTLSARPVDLKNDRVLGQDTNKRMLWEELRRLLLIDRPSHLAREPISGR